MIGLHVIGDDIPELAALVAQQPPASILYLNPADSLPYHAPITVGRLHYEPGTQDALLANPVEGGRKVAHDCIARAKRCGITIWQGLNEICVDNRAWADRYNAFERARVEVLETAGLTAGLYSWSVGWPKEDLSRGNLYPEWYAPLMDWVDHSHYVIFHQYWKEEGPLDAWAYDPLRPSKVDRQRYWPWPHRILITECGIDVTGDPDNGWKARVPPGMNLEQWADVYDVQLQDFDALVSQDERVVAKTVFMFGQGEWSRTFGIETHWRQFDCLVTDPVPMPPVGPSILVKVKGDGVIDMPVEEYLRGVVPAEVYPSWPMKALQAQAVLARSVAMNRIENPRDAGWDIDDRDQVYRPEKVHERTDEAVVSTVGVYLMRDGEPYYAHYISRCGLEMCIDCEGKPGWTTPGNPSGCWPGRACQWGMKALADVGLGWRDISLFYYPNQGVYFSDGGDTVAEDVYVNDVRAADSGTLQVVPRVSTFEELQRYLGPEVDRSKGWDACVDGDLCFKLVGFEVRDGVSSFITHVLDELGDPLPDILVYSHWDDNAEIKLENPEPRYEKANDAGFTNSNGDLGTAYGPPPNGGPSGGPFTIWPSVAPPELEPQRCDAARKLGWIDAHLNCNPIFRLVRKGGATPPVPVPPGPVPPVSPGVPADLTGAFAILSASILLACDKISTEDYLEVIRLASVWEEYYG